MFSNEELRELERISYLPNIYKFIVKFESVTKPLRDEYEKKDTKKPLWTNTNDLCEKYEGFRESLAKSGRRMKAADEKELVMLLKIALTELDSPVNTQYYSSMPPLLFYHVMDRGIRTWK